MLNRIISDPIKTKMTAINPFKEKDLLIRKCDDKPTKIGVVIVKVAIRYAGKYSQDLIQKTYISPNWIAPININLRSKLNFLKL